MKSTTKRTFNEYLSVNTGNQDSSDLSGVLGSPLEQIFESILGNLLRQHHDQTHSNEVVSYDSSITKDSSQVTPSVNKRTSKIHQKSFKARGSPLENGDQYAKGHSSSMQVQLDTAALEFISTGEYVGNQDIQSNNVRHNFNPHSLNNSDLILNKNVQNQKQPGSTKSSHASSLGVQDESDKGLDNKRFAFRKYLDDSHAFVHNHVNNIKVCHRLSGQYSRSPKTGSTSHQVRSVVSSNKDVAEHYASFRKVVRLNKKVWPSRSSCNEDLREVNIIMKSWIKSNMDKDIKKSLLDSTQKIQALQTEYKEQENTIKSFLKDDMKNELSEFQTETISKFLDNQIRLRKVLDLLIHQQKGSSENLSFDQQQEKTFQNEITHDHIFESQSPQQQNVTQAQSQTFDIKEQAQILIEVIAQLFKVDSQPK